VLVDPATASFWADLPLGLKLVIAGNIRVDLTTSVVAERVLPVMRERWHDTDALVERFRADEALLSARTTARRIASVRAQVQVEGRADAVRRTGAWLRVVRGLARELGSRTSPEQADLVAVGFELAALAGTDGGDLTFREALDVGPALLEAIEEHAGRLDGHGFTAELRARGEALFAECEEDAATARADADEAHHLTIELHEVIDRLDDFLRRWFERRAIVGEELGRLPVGFDLAEAHQWYATRPAVVARRRAERAARRAAGEA
jgi:hypothetical protein